jgi:NTP pyrophosphatase (non-canonical NTP hydrolase)
MSKQEAYLDAARIAQEYESEGGEYAMAARHIADKLRRLAQEEGVARLGNINPWHPITNPVDLKHLGKLVEECGELASIGSRCIIQGVDEAHPVTGVINKAALTEEIADVTANMSLVIDHFRLNMLFIQERAERKKDLLRTWHAMA